MSASITIRIPYWLDLLFVWPVLLYRWFKFGYTYRRINLGEGRYTLVDLADYYRLNKYRWYADGKGEQIYAVRNIISAEENPKKMLLHREIMNPPKNRLVDHKNGITLNNRRDNLRLATHSQNQFNKRKTKSKTSSRFIGVCLDKRSGRWESKIRNQGRKIWLGRFVSEIDAAHAYDEAAKKYHGEFAKLNFPKEIERSPKPREIQRISGTKVLGIPKHRDSRGRLNLRLANWLGARLNFPQVNPSPESQIRKTFNAAREFITCKRAKIRYIIAVLLLTLLLKPGVVAMEQRKTDLSSIKRADIRGVEPLKSGRELCLGIDIGSTSSDVVVLDDENRIVLSDYRRTKGKPIETFRQQLEETLERINPADVKTIAATGSAARLPAKLLNIPFINEVAAQAAAVSHLYPDLNSATVIEMGGQDSKLIFLHRENGSTRVSDFALNTVCAAGTGSFLDQQADRLGIKIEDEFGRLAFESKNAPRMAGRCSVFAKSDMIHLQQQATQMCDILAGLCLALARNLKSNLGCGRKFVKPIVFTGGVAANAGVVKAISEVFETTDGDLLVPEAHFFTGAIGAVLVTKGKELSHSIDIKTLVAKIDEYIREQGSALEQAPRRQRLAIPVLPPPTNLVHSNLLEEAKEPIEAYIGVDVGSLSTKAVVMDKQKRILAKIYLMTAGRPLDAIHQLMQAIGDQVKNKVKIVGAASTGSGRYLTGDFIGADVVINEITAQATGAAIVNPKVDTIFEIGGQDSKYISLNNGVVVDFEMNHACAAGTGSFLEEQAQRLGISIKDEFARLAFASPSPIKLGERCTVFMESDLLSYQQQGASTEDLVAGLSYSIVANYLNRVVGRRKIGDNVCFQGGTAFNKAVWAAFEMVTGKPILVPDHHEVTGALGAAAIAAEHIETIARQTGQRPQSKFKGFENLIKAEYTVESFTCEHCSNHCEIKKVQFANTEPLYYGSRCDRYNLKKSSDMKSRFDAFRYRQEKLLEFAGLNLKSPFAKATEDRSEISNLKLSVFRWRWRTGSFCRCFRGFSGSWALRSHCRARQPKKRFIWASNP